MQDVPITLDYEAWEGRGSVSLDDLRASARARLLSRIREFEAAEIVRMLPSWLASWGPAVEVRDAAGFLLGLGSQQRSGLLLMIDARRVAISVDLRETPLLVSPATPVQDGMRQVVFGAIDEATAATRGCVRSIDVDAFEEALGEKGYRIVPVQQS